MSGYQMWRDSGHLERAIETAGGPEAFERLGQALEDQRQGWRLAEMRSIEG